ncbi:hypothetical protein DB41_FX00160 [Neochlamydia sp. TUME1]|jgi:hypothetical protein|nr:hypothetical protein DB41_FX00160 [Neochlamydia sp. TUME1]
MLKKTFKALEKMRRPGSSARSFAAISEDRLPKRRCTALKEALEETFPLGN